MTKKKMEFKENGKVFYLPFYIFKSLPLGDVSLFAIAVVVVLAAAWTGVDDISRTIVICPTGVVPGTGSRRAGVRIGVAHGRVVVPIGAVGAGPGVALDVGAVALLVASHGRG